MKLANAILHCSFSKYKCNENKRDYRIRKIIRPSRCCQTIEQFGSIMSKPGKGIFAISFKLPKILTEQI